jgi:hypothetical protein
LIHIRLRTSDEIESQDRAKTDIDAAMAVWRKSAFRLLMLTLLIFVLSGLVPATGVWRIVVGGLTALVLGGMLAAWIGLDRVPGRAATGSPLDRSTATPVCSPRAPIARGRMGPDQPLHQR